MLKSVNRLKKDSDFQAAFRTGRRIQGNNLVLYYLPNQTEASRCGVIVSRKISRNAVGRNRIRRVLMAELAESLKTGLLPSSIDLVVRVTVLPSEGVSELRSSLKECLKKLS